MIKKFFSINIAVKNLEEAIAKYQSLLGSKPRISSDPKDFAFPGITAASFNLSGVFINLLTTSQSDNPVGKFLASKGEGLLLISVMSDDFEKDIAELSAKGLSFVSPKGFEGGYGKVNFIHPKTMNGVQVEVIQPANL